MWQERPGQAAGPQEGMAAGYHLPHFCNGTRGVQGPLVLSESLLGAGRKEEPVLPGTCRACPTQGHCEALWHP